MKSKDGREEIVSPLMENLVIIPEKEWDATQEVVRKRSSRKKGIKNTTHGTMLLSGLTFCGYCGKKLTSFQSKSKIVVVDGKEEKRFIPKYRCSSYIYPKEEVCEGQSTYSAKKVEKTVVDAIKRYMSTLSTQDLTMSYIERLDGQIKTLKSDLTKMQVAQTRTIKELSALKDEVVKSLVGESKFDSAMLQELLSKKELEVKSGSEQAELKERELEALTNNKQSVLALNDKMDNWERNFESQSVEGQKAMLFQIVDKINVYRDRVEIHINIKMDMFKNGLSERIKESSQVISVPIVGDDITSMGNIAEQSNLGVVNGISQVA